MLKPYQKAYLKKMANGISHRYLIGKGGVDEAVLDQLDKALEANELIKIGLLQNSGEDATSLVNSIVEPLNAEIVQKVGKVVVLYRPSKKNPKIHVPTRAGE